MNINTKIAYIIIGLIFLSNPVNAGLLESFNNSYVDTVSQLPSTQGNPDIIWQEKGNLKAWIDIVGFKNMAYINNKFYISGNPKDNAIVKYDTKSILSCKHEYCYVNSIKSVVIITQDNDIITARLHTIMNWTTIRCYKSSCQTILHMEKNDFVDSEPIPNIFNSSNENVKIQDTYYNHSIFKEKILNINTTNFITKYKVSIKNGSITHRQQIAEIKYTKKGVPYANYNQTNMWNIQGKDIDRQYESIIIDNITQQYNIKIYTPFGTISNRPLITKINSTWTPEKTFAPFTYLFTIIIGTLIFGMYMMKKQL